MGKEWRTLPLEHERVGPEYEGSNLCVSEIEEDYGGLCGSADLRIALDADFHELVTVAALHMLRRIGDS